MNSSDHIFSFPSSILADRLRQVMDELDLKDQNALAKFCDVSHALVAQWFSGSTKLGAKPLRAFATKTNYNLDWLTDGIPPKYRPAIRMNSDRDPIQPGFIRLNALDVKAAAGSGLIVMDYPEIVSQVDVLKAWASDHISRNFNHIQVITADGNSMAPTIKDRDLLFVDTSVSQFKRSGIYVISTSGGIKIKRIETTSTGKFAILSDNPDSLSEYLTPQEFQENVIICAQVLSSWSLKDLR